MRLSGNRQALDASEVRGTDMNRRFTIGQKMYWFIVAVTIFVGGIVCATSYLINANQIDNYFIRLVTSCSSNYATFVDVEYLKELRAVVESDGFQEVRDLAEKTDDDQLIQDYLMEQGLWDRYEEEREEMRHYARNMQDIKYLYIVVWGGEDGPDMYLLDSDDVPLYETGMFEEREPEFHGVDPTVPIEPTFTNSDWGYLCSGYMPIYDSEGNLVCHIGCDVDMHEIQDERTANLTFMIFCTLICVALAQVGAMVFVNTIVVKPLNTITKAVKKFDPKEGMDYKEAGVMDLDIKNRDEIGTIYNEIRSQQIRIVDYVRSVTDIRRDKEMTEADLRKKKVEVGRISEEAYKDALTGVGSKTAYNRKIIELTALMEQGFKEFAIVVMDVNRLKFINDTYGHSIGDEYIRGCVHVICEILKHSPVFRIGGDEFVAVLTGEDYNNRDERFIALAKAFDDAYKNEDAEPHKRYSASVGIAECTVAHEKIDEVFKIADKNMYDAKMQFKKDNGIDPEART